MAHVSRRLLFLAMLALAALLAGCTSKSPQATIVGRGPDPYCPHGTACAAPVGFPMVVTLTSPQRSYAVYTPAKFDLSAPAFTLRVKPGEYQLGGRYEGGSCSGVSVRALPGHRVTITPRDVCPVFG